MKNLNNVMFVICLLTLIACNNQDKKKIEKADPNACDIINCSVLTIKISDENNAPVDKFSALLFFKTDGIAHTRQYRSVPNSGSIEIKTNKIDVPCKLSIYRDSSDRPVFCKSYSLKSISKDTTLIIRVIECK